MFRILVFEIRPKVESTFHQCNLCTDKLEMSHVNEAMALLMCVACNCRWRLSASV